MRFNFRFCFWSGRPRFFAGNHLSLMSLRQHEQKGDFHRLLQDNMAMLLQKATASKYSFQNATSKCYCASTASTVVRSHICWYVQFKGVHARFRKKKEPARRSGRQKRNRNGVPAPLEPWVVPSLRPFSIFVPNLVQIFLSSTGY